MNAKEAFLKAALIKALKDFISDEETATRGEVMAAMLAQYEESGSTKFDVRIGGVKVATLPMTFSKAGPKVDTVAFDAWARHTHPEGIVIPRQPDPYISPAWREEFVASLIRTPDGFVTADGEMVPGVTWQESEPTNYSTRFEKGGKEQIALAWQDGAFAELMPGMAPMLTEGSE